MNRIFRENYPIASLPSDLRPSDNLDAFATVTIEEQRRPEQVMSLEEIFALKGFQRRSAAEIDADLLRMRAEWDG
jgi:hypothetical protein